jgi:hypothetical protein
MAIKLLQNKLPWYPLDRGLGRPQNLSILVKRIISALIRNEKPLPLSFSSYHRHYSIWAKKCKICYTMRQFFLGHKQYIIFPVGHHLFLCYITRQAVFYFCHKQYIIFPVGHHLFHKNKGHYYISMHISTKKCSHKTSEKQNISCLTVFFKSHNFQHTETRIMLCIHLLLWIFSNQ